MPQKTKKRKKKKRAFFPDLNTSAKECVPVRWYSRPQHPNCFDSEQYASRTDLERERYIGGVGEGSAFRACLLSSRPPLPVISPQTRRENRITGALGWRRARKWASAQKWHRLWFLHMLNEAKIYISETLIPCSGSQVAQIQPQFFKITSHENQLARHLHGVHDSIIEEKQKKKKGLCKNRANRSFTFQ